MTRLENKRILVTGGTSGLGRAMALRFAKEGAAVAFTGRREEAIDETLRVVREGSGRDAVSITADHLKGDDNERAIDACVRALGGLDVLVNNAGVIGFDGALEPRPDEFRRLIETNLFAPYGLMRFATPHLVASAASGRDASILNISSVASLRP